jgi:thiol-disulfide isomerase/thioredoxin
MSQPTFSHSNQADQQALPPVPTSRRIWPWLLLLGAMVLVLALRWSVLTDGAGGRDGQDGPGLGAKLTKLDLQPLTGDAKPVSLADLEGKVTLINFWGPWCGFCVAEFPHLVELEKHFRDVEDFQLLSVSSNPDPSDEEGLQEDTELFLKHQQAEFPTYRDPGGASTIALAQAASFPRFGYPTTIVVDRGAVIRGVWVGFRAGDERGMRQLVERVLHGAESDGDFQAAAAESKSGE